MTRLLIFRVRRRIAAFSAAFFIVVVIFLGAKNIILDNASYTSLSSPQILSRALGFGVSLAVFSSFFLPKNLPIFFPPMNRYFMITNDVSLSRENKKGL
jgi:hypothetical protein